MTSYLLFCDDAELGKIECVDGVVSSDENLFSGDDAFPGIYGDIADAIRDGRESVSGVTVKNSLPFILTWNQIDDPSCSDDDEDDDDHSSREKYITINDDPDYWGSVPPDFDLDDEIEKITNAAEDAGIVVYDDCKPTYEVRDNGTEIDWFTEWCVVAHSWSKSEWLDWFRQQ